MYIAMDAEVAYFSLDASKWKEEEDKTSVTLMAWVEILKAKEGMNEISKEINKDVKRLETITSWF